jgi:hypothetical protein
MQLKVGPAAALGGLGGWFWSIGLFSVFVNLLMLTGPLYMLQVYDRVLGSRSEATLVALTLLIAALFAIMGMLDHARSRVAARVGATMQSRLDETMFRAVPRPRALRPARARSHRAEGPRGGPAALRLAGALRDVRHAVDAGVPCRNLHLPSTSRMAGRPRWGNPHRGRDPEPGPDGTDDNGGWKAHGDGAAPRTAGGGWRRTGPCAGHGPRHGGSLAPSARAGDRGAARSSDRVGAFATTSKSFRFFLQSAMLASAHTSSSTVSSRRAR